MNNVRIPLKILVGERITIPKEFLKRMNIKVGEWVLVEINNNQLTIIPAEVIPRPYNSTEDKK